MDDFQIRRFDFHDLKEILKVEKNSFPENPYGMPVFLFYFMSEREGFMVACKDKKVVGYVIATGREGRGLIESVAVVPEFRRRGIGEMLMKAAMDYIAKSFDRVYLQVDANHPDAIAFYRKLSFNETGRILRRYYPNGDDALEMVSELSR